MKLPKYLIDSIIFNYCTNQCSTCTANYLNNIEVKQRCSSNDCQLECNQVFCEECGLYCADCDGFYCSESCFNSDTINCYWCYQMDQWV